MFYTRGEMVPEESVHPDGGAEGYRLSPLQLGMLFHSLHASSAGVDLEQCICELREEIDVARFAQAWREVVSRHAILRTSFVLERGEPRQVVHPASQARLRIHHAEFGSEAEARHGLEAYLADDRREGFNVAEAPLLRVALLSAGPKHHWWVATFHHLLLDGRALVVMFKEVHEIHDALVQGGTLQLPTPRPYRSYIEWLATLDERKAERFWREQLRGLSQPTVLPATAAQPSAGPGPVDPSDIRGELAFRLTAAATTRLRAAAERHGVTMNTLIQAAWALVLSRHTGEEDVVFGAVRACRHIPVEGAGSIIGLFINTVPVRVRVPAEAGLSAWLRGLREQWVGLRAYEHTPLMKVQQWSDVAPGQPLFETLLNFQDPSWDTALHELGGKWTTREFDIRSQPNYPLAVDAYGGAAVMVKMLYDRRRFDDEAIARLMGHYRVTLEALASDTEKVGDLPLLTAREMRDVLVTWQGPVAEYPRHQCVHELFEAHAQRAPGRVAVADRVTSLTYGELNDRATQLAQRLAQHGVDHETLVAVCTDRSCEMLVAWLAALKAGGAFVPLDPSYPPERLGFMLEDSRAPVLLTQRSIATKLPAHSAVVICLDDENGPGLLTRGGKLETHPGPETPVTPDRLAYVIYTSGSTGQPKGVQIEHRALMNLVSWHQQAFAVTPRDRATQLASPAFDASVWEVWPYLTAGASVHIPDEETRISPAHLWKWMAEQEITIGFLPTPLAEAAMNETRPATMSLRLLLTGGDKLHRPPPPDFPCVLVNNYGPTENAVVSTSGVVPERGQHPFTPTIGRPITNARCYILDARLRPVPAGVPGELYIGGASLARGYHNRPELTAEKFVSVTLSSDLPERVYRTGDLVRWTGAGEIEFLGRLDGQVKIRGCRIELGEIEATLHAHPAARESVVLARTDDRGQSQLVAYVLRAAGVVHPLGDMQAEAELAEFLRAKLPGFMVPSAVVLLDAWPLTPNGKIDRSALPPPPVRLTDGNAPFAAPSTPTEETVARIWTEILGRERIGRHDNFFDLGGHSLLAAQVVSRLNHALPAALTVRAVFDQPTIAGLAREVEARRTTGGGPRPIAPRVKRRTTQPEMEALQSN